MLPLQATRVRCCPSGSRSARMRRGARRWCPALPASSCDRQSRVGGALWAGRSPRCRMTGMHGCSRCWAFVCGRGRRLQASGPAMRMHDRDTDEIVVLHRRGHALPGKRTQAAKAARQSQDYYHASCRWAGRMQRSVSVLCAGHAEGLESPATAFWA